MNLKVVTVAGAAVLFGLGSAGGAKAAMLACEGGDYVCAVPSDAAGGNETAGFVGLRWNFGAQAPELVAGVRYTNINENGLLLGALADISFKLAADAGFAPTVRFLGLAGNDFVQGGVGVGYDFGAGKGLVAAEVDLPYVAVGANFLFDSTLQPYVQVSSLGRPKSGGGAACSEGFSLVPVAPWDHDESLFIAEINSVDVVIPEEFVSGSSTCYSELG